MMTQLAPPPDLQRAADPDRRAVTGGLATLIALAGFISTGGSATHLAVVITGAAGAVAALVDLRERILPNRWVVATAVPAILLAVAGAVEPWAVMLGASLLAAPLLAVHLADPSAMGFGDVKFAGALGAGLGVVDPMLGLWALCLASLVGAIVGLAARSSVAPFGPALWFGAMGVSAAASIGLLPGGVS